jgi:membrane-associated protease RseP (regulator of RpoE activity)
MPYENPTEDRSPVSHHSRWGLNLTLLVITFLTTTVAGVQWANRDPFDELSNFVIGLEYSIAILFVLAAHELGHYFAARYHRVPVTLPYFIPFPPIPFFINFGTLGAVIRTRGLVPSRKVMFDIGIAGPIAGFIASVGVLVYGFLTLPGPEFILSIHPNYDFQLNTDPTAEGLPLELGAPLLYRVIEFLLTDSSQFVPPMSEIYHYPYLVVGWFGLFVTAMNLIPLGQFDGGHIAYTMFGEGHRRIARWSFAGLMILGLPSIIDSLIRVIASFLSNAPVPQIIPFAQYSWGGWFLWAMVSYYIVKLYHPSVPDETPLDDARMNIGWTSFMMFILSFSFIPFTIPV